MESKKRRVSKRDRPKRFLSDEEIKELQKKLADNPGLAKDLFENFEKTLTSLGYSKSHAFDEELKLRAKTAFEQAKLKDRIFFERVQLGKPIRIRRRVEKKRVKKQGQ